MSVQIKFCGLTRREDVEEAIACDASYLGVIFAGGPRVRTPEQAQALLAGVPGRVQRVGVFGAQPPEQIADWASRVPLDVVQLHADPGPESVRVLRPRFAGQIWAVLRVTGDTLPPHAEALFAEADAVVLDAYAPGQLGGTGVSFPWEVVAAAVAPLRRPEARLVLAGGLRADNVGQAIRTLAPDIVDVSSGVESAPGIKDPLRLRAFRDAVLAAELIP